MDYTLTGQSHALVIMVDADLQDTEARSVPYPTSANPNALYIPTWVTLKFSSTARMHEGRVSYEGLHLSHITLHGYRLKADGTPGLSALREEIYTATASAPDWLLEMAEEVRKSL
jgi:hypothetical protein